MHTHVQFTRCLFDRFGFRAFYHPPFKVSTVAIAALLSACGGSDGNDTAPPGEQPAASLRCDDSLKQAFKPDADTSVLMVKAFKAGDALTVGDKPANAVTPTAPHDLCMVKLLVGPGNPGPAGAPSTTTGIGIEVWLPATSVWDKRLQLLGTPGTGGLPDIKSLTAVGSVGALNRAIAEKTVSAQTDHAHPDGLTQAFFMNADGGVNAQGWLDMSHRAVHQMAEKTKLLAKGFYQESQKYSYLMGCSGMGRDGYASARNHPDDFDGILAGAPAINWTHFLPVAGSYPQIVYQRDLGGVPLTAAQRKLVSSAAVSACDSDVNGQHDGFITNPAQCRYDPTKDASVLCTGSGGTNTTAACLSVPQALAVSKFWYGPTTDGSVPDPQVDNGQSPFLAPKQLWHRLFSRH